VTDDERKPMRFKVLDNNNGNAIVARANTADRARRDFKNAPAGRYKLVDRDTGETTDAAIGGAW
jgi:hypothetical protein